MKVMARTAGTPANLPPKQNFGNCVARENFSFRRSPQVADSNIRQRPIWVDSRPSLRSRTTLAQRSDAVFTRTANPQIHRGRCARINDLTWRTASGMRSLGSFHGNRLTSDFGASITDSIATA